MVSAGALNAVVESGSTGTVQIEADRWYHVALVIEDTVDDGLCDAILYVDGEYVGRSYDRVRNVGNLVGANIGSYNNGTSSFANITVDGFKIFNRPLVASEILTLSKTPMDLNGDGVVNVYDLAIMASCWE